MAAPAVTESNKPLLLVMLVVQCFVTTAHGSSSSRSAAASDLLEVTLRSQVPSSSGRLSWLSQDSVAAWNPAETCIILVDVWDRHWCPTATERVTALAVLMNATISAARKRGVLIVHAPSDCMAFYAEYPQRRWVLALPNATLPADRPHATPAFPLDASDGGCDVPAESHVAWRRENALVGIGDKDAISAGLDGHQTSQEIFNVLTARRIRNVLYAGVHENMCIMTRPFAVQQLVRWGTLNVAVIRDLVDVMYNPMMSPYVGHADGTRLMTSFIEKFWAPSVSMYDILNPRKPPAGTMPSTTRGGDTEFAWMAKDQAVLSHRLQQSEKATCGVGADQDLSCGSPELNYMCPWKK